MLSILSITFLEENIFVGIIEKIQCILIKHYLPLLDTESLKMVDWIAIFWLLLLLL